ncbi:hypothetical protein ACIPY3_02520 [Paenarthrobacter sp. NPDC089714]|uniref:hypothetical protein n=1 Tax=Paenarthrobacter sp. NPDC089714 TaxID=3364377 RepID=UPI00382ED4E6
MIRVVALATLQFTSGGLFDGRPADKRIHLVRMTDSGTPGPTICGIDRFDKNGPGWSVGGGISGPGIEAMACPGCEAVAQRDYSAAPVWGSTFADLFRKHRKAPHSVRNLPVVATEGQWA